MVSDPGTTSVKDIGDIEEPVRCYIWLPSCES